MKSKAVVVNDVAGSASPAALVADSLVPGLPIPQAGFADPKYPVLAGE